MSLKTAASPLVVAIITISLIGVGPAYAHEHRHVEVGGKEFSFVVGFAVEPAFVDIKNGASLRVSEEDNGAPIEGLQETLKVEVSTGGRSVILDLRPVFGQPGNYIAHLFPTVPGTFTFRFFGTLNGEQINETFISGEEFNNVEALDEIQFPDKTPTLRDLQRGLESIQQSLSDISQIRTDTNRAVDMGLENQQTAQNAIYFGIGGILTGIVGIVVGAVGMRRRSS